MSFAVNEECGKFGECNQYDNFIKAGKPVYHIEYISKAPTITNDERKISCQSVGLTGFSTVMKNMTLNGWVAYCDGSSATTDTSPGGVIPGKPPSHPSSITTITGPTATTTSASSTDTSEPPEPTDSDSTTSATAKPTSAKPTSTKPTTTAKPTSTKTSSSKPTSTQVPGCTQKHWDQCGGNDWKGCTVCAVSCCFLV